MPLTSQQRCRVLGTAKGIFSLCFNVIITSQQLLQSQLTNDYGRYESIVIALDIDVQRTVTLRQR
jgi:uncharacterized membrane protein